MTTPTVQDAITSLTLPPEILDQIGTHLNRKSIACVRSCCVLFCNVFTPFLVNELTLYLSKELHSLSPNGGPSPAVFFATRRQSMHRAIPFVPAPESLARHIRKLCVELDTDGLDRENGDEGRDANSQEKLDTLLQEVVRFKWLQFMKITWVTGRTSWWRTPTHLGQLGVLEEEVLSTIHNTVKIPLKGIEIVDSCMSLRLPPTPTPLTLFNSLKELRIEHFRDDRAIFPLLKEAIVQNSTTLEVLSIRMYSFFAFPLDSIFPLQPSTPSLSFHTLDLLSQVLWQDTPFTDLPLLPNLRHLRLNKFDAAPSPLNQPDRLWDLLRQRHTHIKSLRTAYIITSSLVDYLASYQGLEWVSFNLLAAERVAPDLVDAFIARVLPVQSATLRHLWAPLPCPCPRLRPCPPDSDSDSDQASQIRGAPWPPQVQFSRLAALTLSFPSERTLSVETFQEMLEWLEQFPVLSEAATVVPREFDISGVTQEGLGSIAEQLVGRTGRPRYWSIELSDLRYFRWRSEMACGDTWRFVKFLDYSER
ncbi:hypothetical protein AX16_004177 [Volvariella volvacea WC 439]|nr:hypothetical protein AX16_004177 [Volvariella volvacea WC 439]